MMVRWGDCRASVAMTDDGGLLFLQLTDRRWCGLKLKMVRFKILQETELPVVYRCFTKSIIYFFVP